MQEGAGAKRVYVVPALERAAAGAAGQGRGGAVAGLVSAMVQQRTSEIREEEGKGGRGRVAGGEGGARRAEGPGGRGHLGAEKAAVVSMMEGGLVEAVHKSKFARAHAPTNYDRCVCVCVRVRALGDGR